MTDYACSSHRCATEVRVFDAAGQLIETPQLDPAGSQWGTAGKGGEQC